VRDRRNIIQNANFGYGTDTGNTNDFGSLHPTGLNMKKILVGLVFALGFAAPSLSCRSLCQVSRSSYGSPAYNWSGFYAGLNAGYGSQRNHNPVRAQLKPEPFTGAVDYSGFLVVADRYNYQFGAWVSASRATFRLRHRGKLNTIIITPGRPEPVQALFARTA